MEIFVSSLHRLTQIVETPAFRHFICAKESDLFVLNTGDAIDASGKILLVEGSFEERKTQFEQPCMNFRGGVPSVNLSHFYVAFIKTGDALRDESGD